MRNVNKKIVFFFFLAFLSCGEDQIGQVTDVLGIPAGDKEDSAGFDGVYAVSYRIASNGCKEFPELEVPDSGTAKTVEITVNPIENGIVVFSPNEQLDINSVRGGIDFNNDFKVGGADLISRGDVNNVLRLVLINGRFKNKNEFSGTGLERLMGRVGDKLYDCSFSFSIENGIKNTTE